MTRRWCWPRPRPALESWANADAGKYRRLDLTARFGPAVLPEMRPIDMRAEELPGRALDFRHAAAGGEGADGEGRAGAAVHQPSRLCAGDAVPGLRDADRLRPLRCADGRASVPETAGLPPMRRDEAGAGGLPELRGGGQTGRRRPGGGTAGRGGGGPVSGGADRGAVFGPVRLGARVEGADRGDRGRGRRHHHRHAAGGQGTQLSPADAGGGDRRGSGPCRGPTCAPPSGPFN